MRTLRMDASHPSPPAARYDAVVVGAGPYGLSTAAHLLESGLAVAVFGKTAEMWHRHMPKGMFLRSHWWATSLSDPRRRFGFDRFFSDSQYEKCYPVPREVFLDYACWFQRHAVPTVDNTYVSSVERRGDHFLVTLADGRQVHSATVIMATGLAYYAHGPNQYRDLPAALVSHSSAHSDLTRFAGRRVIIIGGGQSAVEYAALCREAGASVHLVTRRPITWLVPDRQNRSTLLERILAPDASIAPGWKNLLLEAMPYAFYRLPQPRKDLWIRTYYLAAASHWLKERVLGKVTLHEGCVVGKTEPRDGEFEAVISDGTRVSAHQLILATGYRVDLGRLTMLHPALRAEIRADQASPLLNPWFESSVPGMYFVGLTSLRAFGPLFRFVAGCDATAWRVARSIVRTRARR